MHIPGYAVLCRVAFATPSDAGSGYFCALAVPAQNEALAHQSAIDFLNIQSPDSLTFEDTRPLTAAESDGLSAVRLLGDRVHFD
jgi:hypothetical protein